MAKPKVSKEDILAVGKAIYAGYPLKPRPIDVELIKANKEIKKQAGAAIQALIRRGWRPSEKTKA